MATTLPDISQTHILPADIPKRTSSHQAVNPIVSPSSPPRRKSSKRPMSGDAIGAYTSSASSRGKMPASESLPFRPQSSHFPSASAVASAAASSATYHKPSGHSKTRIRTSQKTMPEPAHLQNLRLSPPLSHISLVSESDGNKAGISAAVSSLTTGTQVAWSPEKEKILLGPFDYLYGHPGKDIRSQLIGSFNVWLRVPEQSLAIITKVVGMLHTASLLVDDVEDSSLLRRGAPVANSIFGTAQTINSANYVYFLALQQLSLLQNPTTISIYTEELLNLHRGQGMDLFWRDTLTCPTEEDYLEMVGNKTGGLFRLAIKLMQAESPFSNPKTGEAEGINCIPLVSTIGLLFQILDDLLNLSSPTYTARKGLCEDLTEGKFSFPVIHAIRADPSNLVILNVLAQKTTDDEVKRYAVGYMEQVGSFEYTKGVIKDLERKALSLIEEIERQVGGEVGKEGADGVRGILGKLKTL